MGQPIAGSNPALSAICSATPCYHLARRARRGTSGALYLQSAPAGLNSHSRSPFSKAAARATLRTGSRAAAIREPCQVRKEAALSDHRRVPRNGLVRAARDEWARERQVDSGCTANLAAQNGTRMLTMAVGQSDDVDPAHRDRATRSPSVASSLAGRVPQRRAPVRRLRRFDPSHLRAVRAAFPGIRLVGATSAAEMSSAGGYLEDSVTLALFASDTVDFTVGLGTGLESDPDARLHGGRPTGARGQRTSSRGCA